MLLASQGSSSDAPLSMMVLEIALNGWMNRSLNLKKNWPTLTPKTVRLKFEKLSITEDRLTKCSITHHLARGSELFNCTRKTVIIVLWNGFQGTLRSSFDGFFMSNGSESRVVDCALLTPHCFRLTSDWSTSTSRSFFLNLENLSVCWHRFTATSGWRGDDYLKGKS